MTTPQKHFEGDAFDSVHGGVCVRKVVSPVIYIKKPFYLSLVEKVGCLLRGGRGVLIRTVGPRFSVWRRSVLRDP